MSMRWETLNNNNADNLDALVSILLENRGIVTKEEKNEFLNPAPPEEFTPSSLGIKTAQLNKAVKRIQEAVKENEEIIIYGDYDADGICATAILWEALHSAGAKVTPYIPNRFIDGYGLSAKSVKKLKSIYPNIKLLITVDNGIVAYDGVDAANALGIDVIITDHHSTKEKMPSAHAILHTLETSGSGVAWLFSRKFSNQQNFVELAAIGTIADQLPLVGFNRSLAKHGLAMLSNTNRVGLRKLFITAGLLGKTIGTYEVNFLIAPRINASGRMADGMDALRLLCTTNFSRADKLAAGLHELNTNRQQAVDAALALAETSQLNSEASIIVLSDKKFHEGIIGLIASRLSEKYYRPAIVLSVKGKTAKASARSISGFSIIKAIREYEQYIIEGGGHEMAAGFSIKTNNISEFTLRINEYAKPLLMDEVLERKIKIDCILRFSLINQELYDKISALEPCGTGNPSPVFATQNVKIVSQKLVGASKNHLKLVLEKDDKKIDALMFNFPHTLTSGTVDIVYRLNENTWNGTTNIELTLKDIKEAGDD